MRKKRGVEVQVILDKSNKTDKHSKASLLAQNGIKVYIDSPQGIAHSKVLILEKETVITGSYNFSAAAYSRNAENLLIIKNPELAQRYLKNWEARKALSKPLRRQRADAIFIDKGVPSNHSLLPGSSPLRTDRASFPAVSSSLLKTNKLVRHHCVSFSAALVV
ncbi:phospholipase D-like domain-containing protein [Candidatus Odyssella thessalonicensis]|uniref:phospholipase D-like domain-containing protein n=1 Tax=Candidatus Odyssella thessalonicensis TaxID=84647 RepID=UPI001FE225BB|nr:phospholipase D-like domain-containing protein [Candidatus Odyssella thessalonicensis]